MAIEVNWTDEARTTFEKNIVYLRKDWSEKEVAKFIQQADQAIARMQKLPESFPPGNKSKKYRRARLNRYIVLFYQYHKTKQRIELLTFWNIKQDPEKLKY